MCMSLMFICGCAYVTAHVWRTEDSFVEFFLFPQLYLLNKLSTVDPNTLAQVTVSSAMPGAQNKGAEICRNPEIVSRADHTYLF